MRTMKVGGEDWPIVFTTWAIDKFYRLTGINLYDPVQIAKVFKDNDQYTPDDIHTIMKMAYCALAAAKMPDNAKSDWEPPFSVEGIMNKLSLRDVGGLVEPLLTAYFDKDAEQILADVEKNAEALQEAGQ